MNYKPHGDIYFQKWTSKNGKTVGWICVCQETNVTTVWQSPDGNNWSLDSTNEDRQAALLYAVLLFQKLNGA